MDLTNCAYATKTAAAIDHSTNGQEQRPPWEGLLLAEEARLRDVFDRNIQSAANPKRLYQKTAVLMLSWESNDSELADNVSIVSIHSRPPRIQSRVNVFQIKSLKEVFVKEYCFDAVVEQIPEDKNAQLALNSTITSFALRYNAPGTLLIIYYAGHAMVPDSTKPEELVLLR